MTGARRTTTDHRPPTADHRRDESPTQPDVVHPPPAARWRAWYLSVARAPALARPSATALLLALGIAAYVAVFSAGAVYKHRSYLMGFDLAVHEQVLWNTAHGRPAATSAFAATGSYLGVDVIPTELLLAPIYALLPHTATMLFLQSLAVGLGALPAYLIVRDRWRSRWAGLAFAAALLLYLPVQYTNLYEFQIRAFATTFLLWAFYALERRRFWPFLAWSLLALGCRSEVGLVLAGMGLYALIEPRAADLRRAAKGREGEGGALPNAAGSWRLRPGARSGLLFVAVPVALGLGWFVLCLQVIIPLFRSGEPSLYLATLYGTVDGRPWLGDTPGAIFATLLGRPGFVLGEVFGGSRGAQRATYLVEMFLPFGFMLLLQPRLLLITLPIFGLNLLSNTPHIHANVQKHYQALIVPFMLVGSAYGLHWLLERLGAAPRWRHAALAALVALGLICNAELFRGIMGDRGFISPFASLITRTIDREKIAATERLLAGVPPEAALATTDKIGPHAARRERIFFFPGNVIYPHDKVTQAEYLLIDLSEDEARPEGLRRLAELEASGQYRRVAVEHGVSLWRKTQ